MAARALLVALLVLSGACSAEGALRLALVARGFALALAFVEDPATPGTFFVVSQDGLVQVVSEGRVRETPFLDLRDVVSRGGERRACSGSRSRRTRSSRAGCS